MTSHIESQCRMISFPPSAGRLRVLFADDHAEPVPGSQADVWIHTTV